jgi:toxin ParE1/3/4
MYKYVLTKEAEADIIRIYEYGFGQFGIIQADKYYEMLFDCFDKIASNPFLFPTAEFIKEDYRYCVCGVDTIYYKIINHQTIEISTIIGRQDFNKNYIK